MSPLILRETIGKVGVLTINRPENMNSLSLKAYEELTAGLDLLADDDSVQAVVITGTGGKAFCAGIDIKERASLTKEETMRRREKTIRPAYMRLSDHTKPTIAAVNGLALGGGAELAITCDLRVASENATFGQSEIKWGMIPSCGACQRLRVIAGMGVAKDLILTGRTIEAAEALALGIFNRVVPQASLMEEALNLAREITAHSPVAVRQAKRAIESGADLANALMNDFELSKECFYRGEGLDKAKNSQSA